MERLKITLKFVDRDIKFYDLKTSKIVEKPEKQYIRDICYDNFVSLYDSMKERFGISLIFTDMFRTQKEQRDIYIDRLKNPYKGVAGSPCMSLHLYGQAFDISSTNLIMGIVGFRSYAINKKFYPIQSEWWHFQYLSNPSGSAYDEIVELAKPFLPLTGEEIKEHLELAGYTDIKDFQRDMGLVVDGIAGQKTQIKLVLYNTEYIFVK